MLSLTLPVVVVAVVAAAAAVLLLKNMVNRYSFVELF